MWAKAEADALVEMHDEELKEMELSVKLQNDELSGAAQREIDARALRGIHRECGRYSVNSSFDRRTKNSLATTADSNVCKLQAADVVAGSGDALAQT